MSSVPLALLARAASNTEHVRVRIDVDNLRHDIGRQGRQCYISTFGIDVISAELKRVPQKNLGMCITIAIKGQNSVLISSK